MKQTLIRYADRIDAMTLRERTFVFGAIVVVLLALFNSMALEPISVRQKSLSAQIAQQDNEMKVMQAQMVALVQPKKVDQDALNRDRIKSLNEQIIQLDRQIAEKQKQFVAPSRMAAMLENMLRQNRQLQLISLQNLPASSLTGGPAAAAPAAPPAGAAAAVKPPAPAAGQREIFRHTVELSVRGSYFDLLDYLVALERMKEQVFWGGVELSVVGYPQSVLKLTIYTLSLEKSWLTV